MSTKHCTRGKYAKCCIGLQYFITDCLYYNHAVQFKQSCPQAANHHLARQSPPRQSCNFDATTAPKPLSIACSPLSMPAQQHTSPTFCTQPVFTTIYIHSPGPLFPNAVHVVDDIQVNVSDDDGGVGHGYTSDGGDGVSYNDDGEVGDDDDNGGCEVEPKCWCTCMPRLFAD